MLKSTIVRVCLAGVMTIGIVASLSADHAWGSYHWARTANPFTLKVGDNVSSSWDTYLDNALADWSAGSNRFPDVLDLVKVAGSSNPRNCKPTSGRIEVCNSTYGFNGWLGIAQIWITGGVHITQAITKLNDSYYNTATYNTPAWRQFVTCQEIGHDFGLDHQDEVFANANMFTCMDYTNDPSTNQAPNDHDFEQLAAMYAHLDKTTTIAASTLPAAMPPAMGQLPLDERTQWGQLVKQSANARREIYEQDFGGGNKVITHVFWADPDRDARGRSNR
jgi:hypothetical protein